MIDIATEELVTLSQASKRLPSRSGGKRVHPATLYRWRSPGVRGIRLEVIRVGAVWYTSAEALQRFFNRLTVEAGGDATPNARQLQAEADAAAAELRQRHRL